MPFGKGVWKNGAKLNSTPEKMKTFQNDKILLKEKAIGTRLFILELTITET